MSDWMSVDAATAIEPGSHRIVETDDVRIAVFNIDGNFFAIEDLCSARLRNPCRRRPQR